MTRPARRGGKPRRSTEAILTRINSYTLAGCTMFDALFAGSGIGRAGHVRSARARTSQSWGTLAFIVISGGHRSTSACVMSERPDRVGQVLGIAGSRTLAGAR